MTEKPYPLEKGLRLEKAVIELEKVIAAFEQKWCAMWGTPEARKRRAQRAARARWGVKDGSD